MCDRYMNTHNEAFLNYAYHWFVEHLDKADLRNVDSATKQDIGRCLLRVLVEPALIESWWAQDRMYLREFVVYGSYSRYLLDVLLRWLEDPGVRRGMLEFSEARDWIIAMTYSDELDSRIYKNVARVMAQRWFHTPEPNERSAAFCWLDGYFSFVNSLIIFPP